MGLRIRKRKRTSDNTWLNLFGSGKGAGASVSVRVGNSTFNLGRNRIRSTFNFGDGLTYVSQRTLKKKESTSTKRNRSKSEYVTASGGYSEQELFEAEMKKAMLGMTAEEYTAWYDALSDEDKLKEDNRVDAYVKKRKRQRAYSPRMSKQKHGIIYRFFDHWLVDSIIVLIVAILFNPLSLLLMFIAYMLYDAFWV